MTPTVYDWEPAYGFTETDQTKLAAALEMVRRRICAYGEHATSCDCKYGIGQHLTGDARISRLTGKPHISSEATGCPELRSAIHLLLHGAEVTA